MQQSDIVPACDTKSLSKIVRFCGFDAVDGRQHGYAVLTVPVGQTSFIAMIHNQCLKLAYEWEEKDFPGGAAFADHWNMTNFMGTLIPLTTGFVMKHDTLGAHGLVVGNVAKTLMQFSQAISRFEDEWTKVCLAASLKSRKHQ